MKELIEYIARSLVEDPTEVNVNQIRTGGKVHLELKVAKEDMGRVIGKAGKVANSMRILLRVAAAREGKQVTLDVIEPR
ncbi:MAG: KH domain-containing protein [Anaerolineaceae bacterium]